MYLCVPAIYPLHAERCFILTVEFYTDLNPKFLSEVVNRWVYQNEARINGILLSTLLAFCRSLSRDYSSIFWPVRVSSDAICSLGTSKYANVIPTYGISLIKIGVALIICPGRISYRIVIGGDIIPMFP